jgi:hypothetical protein
MISLIIICGAKEEPMKIFISQLMRDKTEQEIIEERAYAIEHARRIYDGQQLEIIASYFEDYDPKCTGERKALKYLAKSIELLADADAVVFAPGWESGRGCKIEQFCAMEYGIPRIYLPPREEK